MKRIIAAILSVVMVLSLLTAQAFAAGKEMKVSVTGVKDLNAIEEGQTITVSVKLPENTSMAGATFTLSYDANYFEVVDATTDFPIFMETSPISKKTGKVTAVFAAMSNKDFSAKANMLTVTLRATGAVGTSNITLTEYNCGAYEGTALKDYGYSAPAATSVTTVAKQIAVSKITVKPSTLKLEVDQTGTLEATVTPDNATNKTVTWTSDKESVATVANDGTVTAVGAGTATITATAGGKTATCKVTVTQPAHKHNANRTVGGQPSTCVERGWETYYECTECDAVVDKDGHPTQIKYLPLAAHKLTKHDAVPATCTTDGTEAYWTCEVCKQMFSDENGTKKITKIPTVSALGHKFDESVPPTEVVAPSADKVGLYSRTCKNCNHTVYAAELVMIPKDTVNVVVKQSDKSKKDFSKPVTFSIKASGSDGILKFTIDPVTDDIVAAAKTDDGYKVTKSQFTGAYAWGMEKYFDTPEDAYIALNKYLEDGITFTQTISANEKTWAADAKSHTMKVVINRNGTFNVDESTITFTNTFTYSKKAGGGSTTTTDDTTKTDGKKVESGKTFDAGIAMYVGLSVLSVTGGALVIGKKKHF